MSASRPFLQRPWLWLGLGLALLAGLVAQLGTPDRPVVQSHGTPMIGGPFRLIDQSGATRTERSFAGRYGLVYFGYSYCPAVCPTDLAAMSAALARFEAADPARGARVQPVFITVDPERDTVAALKAFAAAFHPRLWALTGTVAAVDQAKASYRVYAQKSIDSGDPDNYLVDHTDYIYLIGPDGEYVAHIKGSTSPDEILQWLRKSVS